jgi:NADH:ubiquinone oxidoreductase subunit K
MGSARVSRVGERVLAIASFRYRFAVLAVDRIKRKECFGATPKPAGGTRALPNPIRREMTPTLQIFLIVSAALFCIGLLAALSRRHAIFILIGIEMMLAAANLNFIAFWRFSPGPHQPTGVIVAIFSIAIAAAEAAVGLALVIAAYRHYRTTNVDQFDQLKG